MEEYPIVVVSFDSPKSIRIARMFCNECQTIIRKLKSDSKESSSFLNIQVRIVESGHSGAVIFEPENIQNYYGNIDLRSKAEMIVNKAVKIMTERPLPRMAAYSGKEAFRPKPVLKDSIALIDIEF